MRNVEATSTVSNIDLKSTIKGFQNEVAVRKVQIESDVQ